MHAVSFAKNGRYQGVAFTLPFTDKQPPLFPHILLKNVACRVSFNTGYRFDGFTYLAQAPSTVLGPTPGEGANQLIMMVWCGLVGRELRWWIRIGCQ